MFDGIVDEIYVLSLPDAAERRARLPGHLAEFGITDFTIHDAFGPDAPEVRRLYDEGKVKRFPPCFRCGKLRCADESCNNTLIPAQVANFASFIALWTRIAATPQVALIIEDDINFHPWAKKGLAHLRKKIASGAVTLEPEVPRLIRLTWPLDRGHRRRFFPRLTDRVRMSNPCHILTSAYTQALLDRLESIDTTSDIFAHERAPRPGEALTMVPPIAAELSFASGEVDSTIHPKTEYLAHLKRENRMEEHDRHAERLCTHISHIYHRPLMITGHPRTGTGCAGELSKQLGLDVGHEADGADGIASWMFAVDADENPWAADPAARTRRALHWNHMVQTVRDPATAVPSIVRENRHAPASYEFRRDFIAKETGINLDDFDSEIEKAVASLTLWNQIIREQSPDFTLRIETDAEAYRQFLANAGYEVSAKTLDTSPKNADKMYKGKRYDKPIIADEEWLGLGDIARGLLVSYCATYGYDLPTVLVKDIAGSA
ncbi:MAG: hypothetical protein HKO95_11235 [Rhodobacteraceae bacterium]|nr:hypothetical protein [Paracoccaceae bacterium]